MPPPLDTSARKELLLTRIAIERAEWVRDVDRLRQQLAPSELLGGLLHRAGGAGWASALFGRGGDRGSVPTGWAGRVMSIALMLRRHPLWWPLIAGVLPWWRARRGAPARRAGGGKLLVVAAGIMAGVGAWWVSRSRRPPGDDQAV